jgi:putative ABC transport system substrate-binding protein
MRRRDFILALGGSVMTCPFSAYGQPAKSHRIGYLALIAGEDQAVVMQRLRELGYREGENLTVEPRSAEGHPERLPALAVELARSGPDLLVAGFGTLTAKAAKAASTTIPIVFTSVGDPVGAGIVASLNRPGGNVTGVTSQASDVVGKRLQVLDELTPGKRMIAVLMNPDTPFSELALQELKAAAATAHQPIEVFRVRTAEQVPTAIEAAAKVGAAGLITLEDPLLLSARRQIADAAARLRLPTVFGNRDFVAAGGLLSYGVDRRHLYRRAADYVDKIIKGAKPADLPVEQPTKFELVINLKVAKTLGLEVPSTLLALADEVVE